MLKKEFNKTYVDIKNVIQYVNLIFCQAFGYLFTMSKGLIAYGKIRVEQLKIGKNKYFIKK